MPLNWYGLNRASSRTLRPRRRNFRRPGFERLEDRCLLAGGVTITLTSATIAGNSTTVRGTLHGDPNTDYSVEFFVGDACGSTAKFLDIRTEHTDSHGDVRNPGPDRGFVEVFSVLPDAGQGAVTAIPLGSNTTGCTFVRTVTPAGIIPDSGAEWLNTEYNVTATVTTVVGNTRAFARRVKAAVGYTTAIGQQLGIIGEEDTTDLSTSNPTGQVSGAAVAGNVSLDFNKGISDGVQVFSKRGSETAFTLLAVDTEPPYVDTRPNLAPGPEMRQYQFRYMLNDNPVGNMSPILTVTVPG